MQRPWHQQYDQGVRPSLEYPDWTVPDLLERSVVRFPTHPALLFYGAHLTFQELDALTTRFGIALHALGIGQGDRVAIMLPNLPQTVIAHYGALKAGAIVVHTNPLYVSREIENQLVDSGSETIVALDLFYPRIQAIQERTPLKRVILTGIRDFLPLVRRLLYPLRARWRGQWISLDKRPPLYEFVALLKAPSGAGMSGLPVPRPDDVALLQYTGGTTGISKGVMLSHRNVVVNTIQCRTWVPDFQDGKEIFLGVVPFFHVYGLSTCLHLAMMTGSAVILLPRFQVSEVLQAIHRGRPTIFSGIPAMFLAIGEHPKVERYDLRSIRVCLSGANPLHAAVQDRFERLTGVKIAEGYGLTEASPVTHCNVVYGRRPPTAIGVPFPDTDAQVVDLEAGWQELPVGEPGELRVKGPQIMLGYWNKPADTQAVLRDGWLHTGDIVRRDKAGFFYLLDRKKDMIKSRGENVYPREVEEVLFQHQAIRDAVVVGVPDDRLGEAVKAFVVLKQGQQAGADELTAHCRQFLATFKVPTTIEFRDELPRTPVGKALRRVLRDEAMRSAPGHKPKIGRVA